MIDSTSCRTTCRERVFLSFRPGIGPIFVPEVLNCSITAYPSGKHIRRRTHLPAPYPTGVFFEAIPNPT